MSPIHSPENFPTLFSRVRVKVLDAEDENKTTHEELVKQDSACAAV